MIRLGLAELVPIEAHESRLRTGEECREAEQAENYRGAPPDRGVHCRAHPKAADAWVMGVAERNLKLSPARPL